MKNKTLLFVVTVLVLMMGTTQNAQAQWKNCTYLGHKFYGEVQEKKPKGEGVMLFNCKSWNYKGEFFTVKGNFDGNIITNPRFINSQLEFIYQDGKAYYDESNNIILKPGGRIRHYLPQADHVSIGIYGKRFFEDNGIELTKDSVINVECMYTNKLLIIDEVNTGLPQELNPPHFIVSHILKLGEYEPRNESEDEKTLGRPRFYTPRNYSAPLLINPPREVKKAKGFLWDDDFEEKISYFKVHGYKDEIGRIWDVITHDNFRVIYPDGSTFKGDLFTNNGEIRIGNVSFKIVYPNGDIFEKNIFTLNNGLNIYDTGSFSLGVKEFVRLNDSKTYPNIVVLRIRDDKGILSGLSSPEVKRVLDETVFHKFPHKVNEVRVLGHNSGYYRDGRYISDEEANAAKAAAEEKESKAQQAEIDKFKRKYGFDPDYKRAGLKVGTSINALAAWKNWVDHHWNFYDVSFPLISDQGTTKSYYIIENFKRIGHFWTRNGVITSITWY